MREVQWQKGNISETGETCGDSTQHMQQPYGTIDTWDAEERGRSTHSIGRPVAGAQLNRDKGRTIRMMKMKQGAYENGPEAMCSKSRVQYK
jgi:hypothetical protein